MDPFTQDGHVLHRHGNYGNFKRCVATFAGKLSKYYGFGGRTPVQVGAIVFCRVGYTLYHDRPIKVLLGVVMYVATYGDGAPLGPGKFNDICRQAVAVWADVCASVPTIRAVLRPGERGVVRRIDLMQNQPYL